MIVLIKVGLITKKWMGCWKETLTDADNFVLDFGDSMDLSQKVFAFVCMCVFVYVSVCVIWRFVYEWVCLCVHIFC